MEAIWNDTVIAESDHTTEVKGYLYFPLATPDRGYADNSDSQTVCPRKDCASHFRLKVDEKVNKDAA